MALDAEALAKNMVDLLPTAWVQVKGPNHPFPGWKQEGDIDTKKDTEVLMRAIAMALWDHFTSTTSLVISDGNQNSITLDSRGVTIVSAGGSVTLQASALSLKTEDATASNIVMDSSGIDISKGPNDLKVSALSVSVNNGALEVA